MQRIGFIGLGIMGKPMAKNILKAGFPLTVYNRSRPAMIELAAAGAQTAADVADLAGKCDIIVTMLPDSPDVRGVALGSGGIAEHAAPGTRFIDKSSVAPAAVREIGAVQIEKGIHMLDAPVSGGEPKAADGTLSIMAGGSETDFERALPLFRAVGSSAVLVGGLGSGNICKLANQVIVACNIAALAEGLNFAVRAGADGEKVVSAIRGGLAGSTVMEAKAPMMLSGNTVPGFKIDLHVKDLMNVFRTAEECDVPLPMTETVLPMFRILQEQGCGGMDHSALFRYYGQAGKGRGN